VRAGATVVALDSVRDLSDPAVTGRLVRVALERCERLHAAAVFTGLPMGRRGTVDELAHLALPFADGTPLHDRPVRRFAGSWV
jgi:hypothetical protein